jgi:hypothetical protein
MPLRLTAAAALLTLCSGLARAQITDSLPGYGPDYNYGPTFGLLSDYERTRSPEDLVRDREIEQKYRETLRTKIPDKRPSNDPWKKIRPAPAAAAVDRHRVE